jgi:hypothetical protein
MLRPFILGPVLGTLVRRSKPVRSKRIRQNWLEQLEDRTLLSDDVAPTIAMIQPVSIDPDNPDMIPGPAIQIRAVATDLLTGNSGIFEDKFRFEYKEKIRGGTFGPWTPFPGFGTIITTAGDTTDAVTLFRGLPYHIYGFRAFALDGAMNEAVSEVRYAEPTISEIVVEIVIDPQCSPTLPPETIRIASDIIDRLSVGDSIGLVVGNNLPAITFPLTTITPDSGVQASAKAALLNSYNRYVPAKMTDLLVAAQRQLDTELGSREAIIALTDGVHSRLAPALATIDSELDPLTAVYGIGYERDANQGPLLDLVSLRDGGYYFEPGAHELDDLDRRLHGSSERLTKLGDFHGTIAQGQVFDTRFTIGPAQSQFIASANWSSGDLNLEVEGPDGTVYSRSSTTTNSNVQFFESERFESIKITAPEWGTWHFRLLGVSVPGTTILTGSVESDTTAQPTYSILDGQDLVSLGDTLDLGSVVQNGVPPVLALAVRNDGTETLTFADAAAPAGFQLLQVPAAPIAPGATVPLTFQMNTASLGNRQGFARFFLNTPSGRNSLVSFTLQGTVNDGSPDETPPPQPSRPDLDSAYDLGSSNNDDLTSRNTLVFRGSAEAGTTVRLYDESSLLGVVTVGHSGRWNMLVGPLTDGEHVLQVEATDAAGNIGTRSMGMGVTIDTVAPAIPTAPGIAPGFDLGVSSSDGITNLAEPKLTGAGVPDGLVELFDGLNLIATTFSDSNGTWQIQNWELSNGMHDLSVRVKDPACNTSPLSSTRLIIVDTIPPAAPDSPRLDPTRDAGISNNDGVTNQNTLIFSGTSEGNGAVQLWDGTALLGSVTANPFGVWSLSVGPLASGPHAIAASATDIAGNTGTQSATMNVLIDNDVPAAPTLDLTAASDLGKSATDDLTSDNTPTFAGFGERNGQVELRDGTRSLGRVAVENSGAWTLTTEALGEGLHNITALVMDVAGNVSSSSIVVRVTIDTVAPVAPSPPDMDAASDFGASNTDNITRDATPVFTGVVTPSATVRLFDGTRSLGTTTSSPNGSWAITSAGLTQGVHSITLRVDDAAGNSSSPSSATVVSIDTTAPNNSTPDLDDSSDRGFSNIDNLTNDTYPRFQGVTEPLSNVELFSSGLSFANLRADAAGLWTFFSSSAGLTFVDGAYQIIARVTDVAGNVGPVSSPLVVSIDTTPPAAPSAPDLDALSDSGISISDNITNDDRPVFSGFAEPGAIIEVFDGDSSVGIVTATDTGTWSVAAGPFVAGSHSISARTRDAAGNSSGSSNPVVVTVDLAAPSAPGIPNLDSDSDGGVSHSDRLTSDTTPTIRGVAEPAAGVRLFEGAILLGSTTADDAGNWAIVSGDLGSGIHRLVVNTTDRAGNQSVASGELVLDIDIAAPTVDHVDLVGAGRGKTGQIVVTFTEQIFPNLIAVRVTQGNSRRDVAARPALISGNTVTWTPVKPLSTKKLSKYTLRVDGVTDSAGNALDGDANGTPGGIAVLGLSSRSPRSSSGAIGAFVDDLLERRRLSAAALLDSNETSD